MVVLGWQLEIDHNVGMIFDQSRSAKAVGTNSSDGIIDLHQKPTSEKLAAMVTQAAAGIALEASQPHPEILAE